MSGNTTDLNGQSPLEELLALLVVRGLSLTIFEEKAAESLLAAGFDFLEVCAVFENSQWAAYYRTCIERYDLFESMTTLGALRRAFDDGLSPEQAVERSSKAERLEYIRRHGPIRQPEPSRPDPSAVAHDLDVFGTAYLRRKNWPESMRLIVGKDE